MVKSCYLRSAAKVQVKRLKFIHFTHDTSLYIVGVYEKKVMLQNDFTCVGINLGSSGMKLFLFDLFLLLLSFLRIQCT